MCAIPNWTWRRSSRWASRAAVAVAASGAWRCDEAEEVEERAFAEHVEQQRGGAEVPLVEQRVQRQLGRRERVGPAPPASARFVNTSTCRASSWTWPASHISTSA